MILLILLFLLLLPHFVIIFFHFTTAGLPHFRDCSQLMAGSYITDEQSSNSYYFASILLHIALNEDFFLSQQYPTYGWRRRYNYDDHISYDVLKIFCVMGKL